MSEQEMKNSDNQLTGNLPAADGTETVPEKAGKKGKRYQGYDIDKTTKKRKSRKKPWFWKVLGISLLLTVLILASACGWLLHSNKKMTDHLSEINDANTMEALLKGHKNVTITCSYSHLTEEEDHTTTRLVKKTKSGEYYSYFKKEGTSEGDYKEVIRNRKLYRYDEKYVRFYGLIRDDYERVCLEDIEGSVFQTSGEERIESENESDGLISIKAVCDVQEGDDYTSVYGFSAGEKIYKSITIDKESGIVLSETESCNDEEFYSYRVEFDGETKVPKFYQRLQKEENTRECTIFDDFGGDGEEEYTFDVPYDAYFVMLDHEDCTVYVDEDCERELTDYQIEIQNPEGEVKLYVKKNG